MKDLKAIATECEYELRSIGIVCGNIIEFKANTRAKRRWGNCKQVSGGFIIDINAVLLNENIDTDKLKSVIIHELLHTVKGCMNHGKKWKSLADKVYKIYGYNIKTTISAADMGVTEEKPQINIKHKFVCMNCGTVVERQRESKFTRSYKKYRCVKCSGNFKKVF